MLDRGIHLKPGGETSRPHEVAPFYLGCIARHGLNLKGSTVCAVGYGGSYGIGLYILENEARRVLLQDPYAPPKHWRNRQIPAELIAPSIIRVCWSTVRPRKDKRGVDLISDVLPVRSPVV